MNILLIALGTRGDVQPALALGLGLQRAGHTVRVLAADNFADWVGAHGLVCVKSGADIQAIMQSDDGVAWTQAKSARDELKQMRLIFEQVGMQMGERTLAAGADADVIIGGFVSDNFAATVAQHLGKRYFTHALQPLQPTRSGEATAQAFKSPGQSILNLWSTQFAEYVLYGVFETLANEFRRSIGMPPFTRRTYYAALHAVPALFGFSRQVVPQPHDWPAHKQVTGYWFLDEEPGWQPPTALTAFLDAGPPPIYVGFGSMSDRDGRATGQMLLQTLKQHRQRVLLAQGWAGLQVDDDTADEVFVLQSAPHSWLFPRMAGVVHHGGAGTTGAAFRAGVPQFVIPHFADQPYWGRRTAELGVGVKPVARRRLTEANFSAGIQALTQQTHLAQAAQALGSRIQAEDGVAHAVAVFEHWIRS